MSAPSEASGAVDAVAGVVAIVVAIVAAERIALTHSAVGRAAQALLIGASLLAVGAVAPVMVVAAVAPMWW